MNTAQYVFQMARQDHVDTQNMTGEQLHNHLRLKAGAEGAARTLLDAGIPGIRYLDRQSRSAGQGSHNFVVFDPRTINIVKRNGMPAMIDAGADALRDHKRGTP
jgi:hypothetical protein